MNWKFRIGVSIAVLGLGGLIAYSLRKPPVEVDSAGVQRGELEQLVVDDGKARVRERYTVSAAVAGTLARIELHEGDKVEPGTVVARILPLPSPLLDARAREVAENHVAGAVDTKSQVEASLSRAKAAAELADREHQRIVDLVATGAMTPADLDRADADLRMHKAELESAEFAEKVAEHGVGEAEAAVLTFDTKKTRGEAMVIVSPVHGRVLHVFQRSEGAVTAGTPLLELGDPQALEIVVDVLSEDAVNVKPGMLARFVHWGGDPLTARVRRIEPSAFTKTSVLGVDEQRVNVLLDPDGDPAAWSAVGDGFAAEVEIVAWSERATLRVPTSALFRRGDGWGALVISNGRAGAHTVTLGHRGGAFTEAVDGLAEGERVILHPSAAVEDGSRVVSR